MASKMGKKRVKKIQSGPIFPDWWPHCQSVARHLGDGSLAPAKLNEVNWPCQERCFCFGLCRLKFGRNTCLYLYVYLYIYTCRISMPMLLGDAKQLLGT